LRVGAGTSVEPADAQQLVEQAVIFLAAIRGAVRRGSWLAAAAHMDKMGV